MMERYGAFQHDYDSHGPFAVMDGNGVYGRRETLGDAKLLAADARMRIGTCEKWTIKNEETGEEYPVD